MTRRNPSAAIACFRMGLHSSWQDRADLYSMVLVYATLMTVFYGIFQMFPMHELHRPDLSAHDLFWYFALTELVLVSVQGNERMLGREIADGQLTSLLQRPVPLNVLVLARALGAVVGNWLVLVAFAALVLPVCVGGWPDIVWWQIPFMLMAMLLAVLIFLLLGYMVGMLEVLGPYSRSFGWMLNKIIFTFGGLFFPVLFFPHWLQKIAHATPAPSVLFAAGHVALHPTWAQILAQLGEQMVWLVLLLTAAQLAERKMIAHVLRHGE